MLEILLTLPFGNPENFTGASSLFEYNNSVTGNLFMPIMLLVIWIILFFVMKSWQTEAAMGASTFVVLLLSIILKMANLIPDWTMAAVFIGFIAVVFIMVFSKEKSSF